MITVNNYCTNSQKVYFIRIKNLWIKNNIIVYIIKEYCHVKGLIFHHKCKEQLTMGS